MAASHFFEIRLGNGFFSWEFFSFVVYAWEFLDNKRKSSSWKRFRWWRGDRIPFFLKEACKYKLRSDCDGLLLNPVKFKTLTTLGDRSFAAAAPQLWNSLPYSIRSSRSVTSFKKTLKTFFFQKAFLWFYVLFNLVFSRFYAVFYDLSSLGNFYSFSVDIIVLLFLVGSCTFCMYTLCTYYYYYYFIFFVFLFFF